MCLFHVNTVYAPIYHTVWFLSFCAVYWKVFPCYGILQWSTSCFWKVQQQDMEAMHTLTHLHLHKSHSNAGQPVLEMEDLPHAKQVAHSINIIQGFCTWSFPYTPWNICQPINMQDFLQTLSTLPGLIAPFQTLLSSISSSLCLLFLFPLVVNISISYMHCARNSKQLELLLIYNLKDMPYLCILMGF